MKLYSTHKRTLWAALATGAFVAFSLTPCAAQTKPGDRPRALRSQPAPKNAVVLFDGTDLSGWESRSGGPATWRTEDGAMFARGGDILTRRKFGDFRLHVEFNIPSMPQARGQGRGNSGVYMHGLYEIQVLDSYGPALDPPGRPLQNDEAGAIYGQKAPRVNATLPPGTWQTYDIWFRGPRFGPDGAVTRKPRLTVYHNGVLIHHDVPVEGATRASLGSPPQTTGPVLLQDHGNMVRYRNIWIVPM